MLVRILVVDDDPNILSMVKEALTPEGFRVDGINNASDALALITKTLPDLLILDWKLPDRSGVDICRILRADTKTAGMPVIMLTGISGVKEKVDALKTGADDYVTKPFYINELKARVHAVLRRKIPWLVQSQILEFKGLKLDPGSLKAFILDKDAGLTKVEFEILYLLASNAGRLVSRSYIENRVLDQDYPTDSRPLDVHLSHLREKLGPKTGRRIETVRGVGYIFSGEAA